MKPNNLSVIIIDDDEVYAAKLKAQLASSTDKIAVYHSANNATPFIEKLKPDLILLDNRLPFIYGGEVIGLFKELSPDSLIVLMSIAFKVEDIAKAIQGKADFILNKREITKDKLHDIFESVAISKAEKTSIWRLLKVFQNRFTDSTPRTIAIVEDDEIFALHLEHLLKSSPKDHQITSYRTVKAYFTALKKTAPDILFLDYALPDGTGKSIAEHTYMMSPKTIIVVISGQENPKVASDFNQLGVYGYVMKDLDWKVEARKYMEELDL